VKRAVLYARASTRKRSQDTSPPRQLEQLRAVAKARGWKVVATATDRLSGRTMDRPELRRLLEQLQLGRAEVLMVVDLDRLGRKLADVVQLVDNLHHWGAELVVLRFGDGPLDTTSAQGRMFFQVVTAFAEFVSNLHAEKIRDGLASAKARGVRLGQQPKMDAAARTAARRLRSVRLKGKRVYSFRAIARELEKLKLGRFDPATIRRACA